MGINFFFTFPTSEGSDLLSSHVMQTPTFISKLSDGNVIFRLDVGKRLLLYNSSINSENVKKFPAAIFTSENFRGNFFKTSVIGPY
jgi:hypothetical protein